MKRMIMGIAMSLALGGCTSSLKWQLGGHSSSGGGSSGGGGSGPSESVVMPDLIGMTREQAEKKLKSVGITGDVDWDVLDCGDKYEVGKVCYTHPVAGATTGTRLPLSINLQEGREAGGTGDGAWVKMPDVRGMDEKTAKKALAAKGIGHVEVEYVDEPPCEPGKVCASSPPPESRAYLKGHHAIYVQKPGAPARQHKPDDDDDRNDRDRDRHDDDDDRDDQKPDKDKKDKDKDKPEDPKQDEATPIF